ncbi:hypothetical protein F4861DRAFT_549116 [Xylaria intraflava]|nr:hypothetical protein F4861DRAFT_549116 [Xylaria intraflava]
METIQQRAASRAGSQPLGPTPEPETRPRRRSAVSFMSPQPSVPLMTRSSQSAVPRTRYQPPRVEPSDTPEVPALARTSAASVETSRPPTKHSSSTAQRLLPHNLWAEQARATSERARVQFEAATAGPPPGYPPTTLESLAPASAGGNLPPRGFSRIPEEAEFSDHEERTPTVGVRHLMAENERLARALEEFSRPSLGINQTHLQKPSNYDGKDITKFKGWWFEIRTYVETYPESFRNDKQKIFWTGSLLKEKAREWHQQRIIQVEKMRLADTWESYSQAIMERFTDYSESARNAKKMKELKYTGDISQYLSDLLQLNLAVEWSGKTFRNHISAVIPRRITEMRRSEKPA